MSAGFSGYRQVTGLTIEVHQGHSWDSKERYPRPGRPPATEYYGNEFIVVVETPSGSLKLQSKSIPPGEIDSTLRELTQTAWTFMQKELRPPGEREV